jgi:hypothetical protein
MQNLVLSVIDFTGSLTGNKESIAAIDSALAAMKSESTQEVNWFDLNRVEKKPTELNKLRKRFITEGLVYFLTDRFSCDLNTDEFHFYNSNMIGPHEAVQITQDFVKNDYTNGQLNMQRYNLNTIKELMPPSTLDNLYEIGKAVVFMRNQFGVTTEIDWMDTYWSTGSNSFNTLYRDQKVYMSHYGCVPMCIITEWAACHGISFKLSYVEIKDQVDMLVMHEHEFKDGKHVKSTNHTTNMVEKAKSIKSYALFDIGSLEEKSVKAKIKKWLRVFKKTKFGH